jgi:stage V sporulation protein D (sporulation-specific penicillin-binding protein)
LSITIILTGRLVYVQLFKGSYLKVLASEQWYRDLPLQAMRGDIYDANGLTLATSQLSYSIYLRPVEITDAEIAARELSSVLQLDYASLLKKISGKAQSEILVKMGIDKETAMNLVGKNLGGVYLSQTYTRLYPQGSTAGQILGLVSIDGNGQEGLEKYYNELLMGTNGKIATEADLRGVKIENGKEYYVEATAGQNLTLNIDAQIQQAVQNALQKALTDHKAKAVSALVMDIETGAVVASGSAPFYDMNEQPRDNGAELLTQIKNLPIINVLEPGSTFKIITLAAAIEEGVVDLENDRFSCSGTKSVDGERIRCWRSKGHGVQTLQEGVNNSCNCVFMELALRVGVEKYYEYLKKFGLGEKTGVDFSGESSGLLLNPSRVRTVDLARIGFGQAIAVSPVQLLSAVSAIIGDGNLRSPRFVGESPVKRRVVSAETNEIVRNLLYGVVNDGSGKHAGVAGYQIGGKTGTAQKYKNGIIDQGHYISSFLGFISNKGKPKYACYFYVDEPSTGVYYGSLVAAPYVGNIFQTIAILKNFESTGAAVFAPIEIPEEMLW